MGSSGKSTRDERPYPCVQFRSSILEFSRILEDNPGFYRPFSVLEDGHFHATTVSDCLRRLHPSAKVGRREGLAITRGENSCDRDRADTASPDAPPVSDTIRPRAERTARSPATGGSRRPALHAREPVQDQPPGGCGSGTGPAAVASAYRVAIEDKHPRAWRLRLRPSASLRGNAAAGKRLCGAATPPRSCSISELL